MINLAEEWRKLDGRRRTPDSQKHWDERAKSFSFKDTPDAYLQSFISKAGITGEESVLDMGCGTGSLAVALASMGCSVVAADFSTGMLDRLHSKAAERGVLWERGSSEFYSGGSSAGGVKMCPSEIEAGKILPLRMSWEDDWANYGVEENSVDVAVASRSVITHDLEDSLKKLSAVACKKVCVTVGTGFPLVSICVWLVRWAWSLSGTMMLCSCLALPRIWGMNPPFLTSTHPEPSLIFRLMRHIILC